MRARLAGAAAAGRPAPSLLRCSRPPHPHRHHPPQLCYLPLTVACLLPLSLGIDGADWGAQFAGWSGAQWALLVATGTAVYLGGNFLLQVGSVPAGVPCPGGVHLRGTPARAAPRSCAVRALPAQHGAPLPLGARRTRRGPWAPPWWPCSTACGSWPPSPSSSSSWAPPCWRRGRRCRPAASRWRWPPCRSTCLRRGGAAEEDRPCNTCWHGAHRVQRSRLPLLPARRSGWAPSGFKLPRSRRSQRTAAACMRTARGCQPAFECRNVALITSPAQ